MERIRNAAATLLLATLAACGGGGGTPAGGDPGSVLSVAKPGAASTGAQACGFEHVWITVERIRVIGEDSASDIELAAPRRIDLMALPGGVFDELRVQPLPPGRYRSLQLVLSPNGPPGTADELANAVQPTGAGPVPLATPSATQSGIKLPLDAEVPSGQAADISLLFDVCKSVLQAGHSGRFQLKPVIAARLRMSGFAGQPAQLVNSTTAGDQFDPHVAALADGSHAIVWTQGSLASGRSTYGQKFDAAGARVGGEVQVFDGATADALTGLPTGGFAIAATGRGGDVDNVLAQRLDTTLVPVGAAQVVVGGGEAPRPLVARGSDIDALPDGGFLVTAQVSDPRPPPVVDHYVRRFDANGLAVSAPLRLPPRRTGDPAWSPASTSVLSNGSWVSAWDELFCRFGPCFNLQAFAALFNGSDTQLAALNFNPNANADEFAPSTAALRNGGFVIAWVVRPFAGAGPLPEVQLQLFDQAGHATSAVMGLETPEILSSGGLRVTALASGGFLVSVAKAPQPGEDPSTVSVLGQHVDATGQASGPLFPLGSARHPSRGPKSPNTWSVAALPGGGFVFASELPGAGTGSDIYQRRFVPAGM